MRGRIIVALLALGLMGTGTSVVVAESGTAGGASSAQAEYKCSSKDQKFDKHTGTCVPKHCPKGYRLDEQTGTCVPEHCPNKGDKVDERTGTCVSKQDPDNDGDGEGKADHDGNDE